ncbi:hypothetical protein SeMB42_g07396 [Synchytrium endobioticum]|uniref:Uncharacterized protein n=1 Tax=Synchytrium endobioticum TaxID=286115 RepID=A0A507C7C1_9FUNG|nr:hypothetical protein SeMB42_g07396 [Synchytrium endobioticum]
MWSLYGNYHEKYIANLTRPDRSWTQNAGPLRSKDDSLAVTGASKTRFVKPSTLSSSVAETNGRDESPAHLCSGVPELACLSLQSSYASNIGQEARHDIQMLDAQIRQKALHDADKSSTTVHLVSLLTYDAVNRQHHQTHVARPPHVAEREHRFGLRNDCAHHTRLARDSSWAVPGHMGLDDLRRQERKLLVNLWAQQWWYEMADKGFSDELVRNRRMLVDARYRERESECRTAILDMYRAFHAEETLFAAP